MMTHHLLIVPLVAVILAQLAAIATSVYLHRGLAHRSLRLYPAADVCFRTILWLTTGQNRREWVAVHRKHHTFTDKEGDPHSPRVFGNLACPALERVLLRAGSAQSRDDPDIRAGHHGGLVG